MASSKASGRPTPRFSVMKVKALNPRTGQWSTRESTAGRPTQSKEQPGPYRGVRKEK